MTRIIALGGGGFSDDPLDEHGRGLDQVVLDATDSAKPRLCFIGTACGDAESYTLKFYRAFEGRARLDDLNLTLRPRHPRLREFVLGMDAVYVGGGSTLDMLAVWRTHGLDDILREAVERGVVLSGVSAGMICWFEQAATDSIDDGLRPIDGLGLLPGAPAPTSPTRAGASSSSDLSLTGARHPATGPTTVSPLTSRMVCSGRRCPAIRPGARRRIASVRAAWTRSQCGTGTRGREEHRALGQAPQHVALAEASGSARAAYHASGSLPRCGSGAGARSISPVGQRIRAKPEIGIQHPVAVADVALRCGGPVLRPPLRLS